MMVLLSLFVFLGIFVLGYCTGRADAARVTQDAARAKGKEPE